MNLLSCLVFHIGFISITVDFCAAAPASDYSEEDPDSSNQPFDEQYPDDGEGGNYLQSQNSAVIIRDDLIPRKPMFPYYELPILIPEDESAPAKSTPQKVPEPKRTDKIRYFARWKNVSNKWSPIFDKSFKLTDHWTVGGPVKVLIHGYTPTPGTPEQKIKEQRQFDIGNAYIAKNVSTNVILMDWTSLSSYSFLKYYESVDAVQYASKHLENLLLWLGNTKRELISDWRSVHLIGFSLGAHLAGSAGHRIIKQLNGSSKIGRITGIDPAGPWYHEGGRLPPNRDHVLDWEDAEFVDVIHCNMERNSVWRKVPYLNFDFGRYGTPAQSGHADFYPNGGETQKGCSNWEDKVGCSHSKCLDIFLKSIQKEKASLACRCQDWEKYKAGGCPCSEASGGSYLGDPADPTARHRYYSY